MTDTGMNERDEVEALLPFLANDTLEGAERAEVEAAVAADADLAVQLRALRRIRTEVKAEVIDWSPGEMGLTKLMREIEAEAPGAAEPAPLVLEDVVTGQTPVTSVKPAAAPKAANSNIRLRLWQVAAAIAVAAFAAQSVFVWTGSGDRPDVELASGDALAPIGDGRLRVAFQGSAPEGDIRALLLSQNLVIIDGPSALGLYTIAVEEVTMDDAIAALLSKRALVESVSVEQ